MFNSEQISAIGPFGNEYYYVPRLRRRSYLWLVLLALFGSMKLSWVLKALYAQSVFLDTGKTFTAWFDFLKTICIYILMDLKLTLWFNLMHASSTN